MASTGSTSPSSLLEEKTVALSAARIVSLPYVEAALNFVTPETIRARNYNFAPPPGVPKTSAQYNSHRAPIWDMRPIASRLTLENSGFSLINHESAVQDFYDEDEVRDVCYAETEALLKAATGAKRTVVFDHTVRSRTTPVADRATGEPREPVLRVHNDYTANSGPQRVRDLLPHEADTLLKKRFAIVNLWRPIRGPLEDSPLAICDAQSVAPNDLVTAELVYPDRTGEYYLARFNPCQRWFYAPRMQADEALLIKCFDSATDGRARFTPHTAFADPAAPVKARPRESIELRTLLFFG
jgi:hypothetical protein